MDEHQPRKKLLIATDNYLPRWDGIARFLAEIIPFLTVDFEVSVIAPNFPGKKGKETVTVHRIPVHYFRIGDFTPPRFRLRNIAKLVKEHDIIFSQTIGPIGGSAVYFGRMYHKEVISYIHSIEWELVGESIGGNRFLARVARNITKKSVRWLYSKCDLLLVPSKDVKDLLESEGIMTPKRILHLGVNTTAFVPPKNRTEAKKRIGWDTQKIYIGFHGRIAREKDLPTLHDAFHAIHHMYPNTKLVIIGTGMPELMRMFEGEHSHALGIIDPVVPYLQAIDIYVLPSLTETTSLSTMEAMACGCAVITTPVGYIRKYIIAGHNGYFFDKGNVQDLAHKLEALIKNKDLRETIGKNARKTIVNYYRWSETVRKMRDVLNSL